MFEFLSFLIRSCSYILRIKTNICGYMRTILFGWIDKNNKINISYCTLGNASNCRSWVLRNKFNYLRGLCNSNCLWFGMNDIHSTATGFSDENTETIKWNAFPFIIIKTCLSEIPSQVAGALILSWHVVTHYNLNIVDIRKKSTLRLWFSNCITLINNCFPYKFVFKLLI